MPLPDGVFGEKIRAMHWEAEIRLAAEGMLQIELARLDIRELPPHTATHLQRIVGFCTD